MNGSAKVSFCGWLVFALATAPPAAAQSSGGYFNWPLGRQEETGVVVPGHDLKVLFDYGRLAGGEAHGGVDLIWSTGDNREDGSATIAAPVYAVADGKLVCENRGAAYTNWPGRVIVIEHSLTSGELVYSLYGHLRYPVDTDPFANPGEGDPQKDREDPEALPVFSTESNGSRDPNAPPIYVKRGQQIGTVLPWMRDGVWNLSNSHVHFEIRTTRLAQDQNGNVINCQGKGYAPSDYTPEQLNWLDPVDFIFEHGPSFPFTVLTNSFEPLDVRTLPTDARGYTLHVLLAGSTVLSSGLKREGNGQWWYQVDVENRAPSPPRPKGPPWPLNRKGYVKAFAYWDASPTQTHGSDILATTTSPPWSSPSAKPLVEYLFEDPERLASGYTTNTGTSGRQFDGRVFAEARVVPGSGPGSNWAIELDGATSYVENMNRARRSDAPGFPDVFRGGVAVSAVVRRDSNADEDAILSKWYLEDQWLLTIYASGHGSVIFSVRLEDGTYRSVGYDLPDDEYIGEWSEVAAAYEVVQEEPSGKFGRLQLFWRGRLVAEERVDGSLLSLWPSSGPIHVGDAGPGTSWSRFHGAIDGVRIWRPAVAGKP